MPSVTRPRLWQEMCAEATAAQRAGDHATALRLYSAAAAFSRDPAPSRLLALLLAETGQLAEATAAARRSLALDPRSAHSQAALGRILLQAGDVAAAEGAFAAALDLDPRLAPALQGAAALHRRRGLDAFAARRWGDAAKAFAVAARLRPDSAHALHDLGTALHEGGQLAEAAEAYRRALAIDGDRVETWHNLGSVRQALRDMDGALTAYARAYALRPDSFARIAQELAAGNPGRVWLRAGDLRLVLAAQARSDAT